MITVTLDRLRALHLGAMADAYLAQQQAPAVADLGFDERVSMLVDAEHLSRDNRKLARRLKEAKLRVAQACLEDLEYAPRRELDQGVPVRLAGVRAPEADHGASSTGIWAVTPAATAALPNGSYAPPNRRSSSRRPRRDRRPKWRRDFTVPGRIPRISAVSLMERPCR